MSEINNIDSKPSVAQIITDRLDELDRDRRRGQALMAIAQLLPQLLVSDEKIAEIVKESDLDIIGSARYELCRFIDYAMRHDNWSVAQNQMECQSEEYWSLVNILRRVKEAE